MNNIDTQYQKLLQEIIHNGKTIESYEYKNKI